MCRKRFWNGNVYKDFCKEAKAQSPPNYKAHNK